MIGHPRATQCDRLSGELASQAKYSSMHLVGEIMPPDDVAQRFLVLCGVGWRTSALWSYQVCAKGRHS